MFGSGVAGGSPLLRCNSIKQKLYRCYYILLEYCHCGIVGCRASRKIECVPESYTSVIGFVSLSPIICFSLFFYTPTLAPEIAICPVSTSSISSNTSAIPYHGVQFSVCTSQICPRPSFQ